MIDNTRLPGGQRAALALAMPVDGSRTEITLAYFPGSRASLKDKQYYEEMTGDLLNMSEQAGKEEKAKMTNRNHHHAVVWLLTTAVLFLLPAVAQEGKDKPKNPKKKIATVVVEVKEKQSQEPVTGAIVFLRVDGSDYQHSPESDEEGKAEFTEVPQGQATIQATKDGWKTAGLAMTLDDKTHKISLQMEKK